jgi:hypothetical protein
MSIMTTSPVVSSMKKRISEFLTTSDGFGVFGCVGGGIATQDLFSAILHGQAVTCVTAVVGGLERSPECNSISMVDHGALDLILFGWAQSNGSYILAGLLVCLATHRDAVSEALQCGRSSGSNAQPDIAPSQQSMVSHLQPDLRAIPDPIPPETHAKLEELYKAIQDTAFVGSDGQLYQSAEGMPSNVYSLGRHLFSQWDGSRDDLKALLTCPISHDLISEPVIVVTKNGFPQNTKPCEKSFFVQWVMARLVSGMQVNHPIIQAPMHIMLDDSITAEIIQLLLEHQPVEQPPAQQSMADPASQPGTPTAPLLASECPPR